MAFRNPRETAIQGWEGAVTAEEKNYPLVEEEREVLKETKKDERPKIQDFDNVYSLEEIAEDQEWLEQQRSRGEEIAKTKRSKILEHVIKQQAETADWLGGNCYTIETTEYDDRKNHIDFVIEWQQEDGQIQRLAIDVTTTEDPGVVGDKEQLIRKEIESGQLNSVKYFESEAEETKGEITQLPRVVLAVDKKGIQKLCRDLVHKKPREMAKNPEQLLLLKQIQSQMVDQIEYALKLLLENTDRHFHSFKDKEKEELKKLAEVTAKLEESPEELTTVLETLDKQKNLLNKIQGLPTIQRYANVIRRQQEILKIADHLIQEKNGSLDSSVVQQAVEQEDKNIVLQRSRSRLKDFRLPAHLRNWALAA